VSESYVRMRLATERYAIPVDRVREVTRAEGLTPVPGAGPAVLGVCNLRGQVLPVLDLARALGVGAQADPQLLLVVEDGGRRTGLTVDEVTGVERLPDVLEDAESELLAGAVLTEDALIGVLDVTRLLDRVEAEGAP
jgi:chemotaxis signal transduction protein